ncbi:MAG: hypothetical protein AMDU2_EPLC00007G0078 [Thermoplasmatales archaeon E-plasma]|jgi:uncharacterized protein|nr:MAG: hypothetical protein AMDU2_EPLC00007G0078 [Thermoplasmatales archaeon E-plasma]
MEKLISTPLPSGKLYVMEQQTKKWAISLEMTDLDSVFKSLFPIINSPNGIDKSLHTIVINTTDICNLDCIYCVRANQRVSPKNISIDVLVVTLKKAISYASNNNRKVTIQFHGGEATFRLNEIITALRRIDCRDLKNWLTLRIQTNGTRINADFISFVKEFNIEVGISLDGPPPINDKLRTTINGGGTSNSIEKGINELKNSVEDVRLSCLAVLSKRNIEYPEAVLNYLSNFGFKDIALIPMLSLGNAISKGQDIIPNTEEMVGPLKKFFDLWIEKLKAGQSFRIPIFQAMIWNLIAVNAGKKTWPTNCGTGVNMIMVEENGDVYPCSAVEYVPSFKMGNMLNENLEDILNSSTGLNFQNRITDVIEDCQSCPVQSMCGGGCPGNSYIRYHDLYKKDPNCNFWRALSMHIINEISNDPTILKLMPSQGGRT